MVHVKPIMETLIRTIALLDVTRALVGTALLRLYLALVRVVKLLLSIPLLLQLLRLCLGDIFAFFILGR